ncbi:MAG: hypothetical protein ABIQ88_15005 [Chitinophagaceae bacterium]
MEKMTLPVYMLLVIGCIACLLSDEENTRRLVTPYFSTTNNAKPVSSATVSNQFKVTVLPVQNAVKTTSTCTGNGSGGCHTREKFFPVTDKLLVDNAWKQ